MDQLSSGARMSGVATHRFRVWGRFAAIRCADGAEVTPRGRKARALLAFLLIEGQPVARDRLAGLLWSERGQAQAQASLRQSLVELREFASPLQIDRHRIAIDRAAAQVDLDDLLMAAEQDDAGGLAAAITAGADLLEDLDGIDPAFDQWLRTIRATRTSALIAAAHACGNRSLGAGETEPAETLARALLAIDPLDEEAARLAMTAAHRAGRQESVQRIHERLVADLQRELGVEPSAETRALHGRLVAPAGLGGEGTAEPDVPAKDADAPSQGRHASRRSWVLVASVLLVFLVAAAVLLLPRLAGDRAAEPTSLAVLPFRNLSAGDDHFAEGVAEEILAQLAREPQLRVAGRTSSWLFKDPAADLREVGRRLEVAYILEGSVRRAGDNVRVDVALVGTSDGMRLWSHAFRGRLDDIFAIQDEIGREVAGALRLRFARAAPPAPAMRTSGEVHSLYLTARGLIRTRDRDHLRTAESLLRRAVRLDPNYAPAWSSLGQALRLTEDGTDQTARQAEAMRHVDRALALAPQLAEAHAVKGLLLGRAPAAVRHLERAIELDPNHAEAWHWLADVRREQGDVRGAYEASRRVADIDPFWINGRYFADNAWDLGQRAQSLAFEQNLAARHPEASHRELALARVANRRGDWSAFALHLRRAVELDRGDTALQIRDTLARTLLLLELPPEHSGFIGYARSRWPDMVQLFFGVMTGELPPRMRIQAMLGPRNFWDTTWTRAAARRFLNENRAADLLYFYDSAFESPEAMADGELEGFAMVAPEVALALRQTRRHAEAERLLALAERRGCGPAIRFSTNQMVECSRILAVVGRREAAVGLLQRATARGWPNGYLPDFFWQPRPVISEEPAWSSIRDDPRIRRIDTALRTRLARERSELVAAWPETARPGAR